MEIIARRTEIALLESIVHSGTPEFVAVYGRRRVGKTFLIRNHFSERFSFYASGLNNRPKREQLKNFNSKLVEYGLKEKRIPQDWSEAFSRLKSLLEDDEVYRDPKSGRRVVFLDEVPWMDGKRSDFRSSLDLFWNTWGSTQEDLLLIICGSATSWVMKYVIKDTGGFYNRITNQIHLLPFSLGECELFAQSRKLNLSRRQILEYYMSFGGIPYYWSLLFRDQSPMQNIQRLCFEESGSLKNEYPNLFKSLFSAKGPHQQIVEFLAGKEGGALRSEIIDAGIKSGKSLSLALEELEQCGFVHRYYHIGRKERDSAYQLIDPFTRFALSFLRGRVSSWQGFYGTPSYYSWAGRAFETLCLNHIHAIKAALGISGVLTNEFSWRSSAHDPGAQIDLVIERRDGIIDLCEMKYSEGEYAISSDYERKLRNKISAFREETGTKSALHLVVVASNGFRKNAHSDMVVVSLSADDLFR